MTRLRFVAVLGVALVGLVLGTVGVASAASGAGDSAAGRPPGPGWHRFHQQPFVEPAGDPCPFQVTVSVVRDQEWFRTLSRYRSHAPFVQQFTGPLYLRYQNAATGKAVVRNLSGTAFFTYGKDGSLVAPWRGGGGITVHPGNRGAPSGEWVFHGTFILFVDSSGNRRVQQFAGSRENLCRTLR